MSEGQVSGTKPPPAAPAPGRSSARIVVAIALSRILGLLRDRWIYGSAGFAAASDIITFSLKVANSIQNLLGEQALSAALVPTYSRRLQDGRAHTPAEARELAGAVFARLLLVAGALGLLGVLLAPVIARPAGPENADLYTLAIRFLFPMAALLVLSAWCLAVLNSHRRFFLAYLAPALWNLCILAALGTLMVAGGEPTTRQLVVAFSVGALVGGVFQFGVQFPSARRLNGGLPLSLRRGVEGLGETQRNFVPILLGRGSLQITTIAETFVVLTLAEGTQASLGAGQRLFFLTLLVCGMVQAIVYLPEFSRSDPRESLTPKIREALHAVWFLVVPSTVGVVLFGYPLVAGIYRTGSFGVGENLVCYLIFGVYVLGLLPTASSRILQSALYSRGRTLLPAAAAAGRSLLALGLALAMMGWWNRRTVDDVWTLVGEGGLDSQLTLGALAFACGSVVAAFVEWVFLLRRAPLQGPTDLAGRLARYGGMSLLAAIPAGLSWWAAETWLATDAARSLLMPGGIDLFHIARGGAILTIFVAAYLGLARLWEPLAFRRLLGKVG